MAKKNETTATPAKKDETPAAEPRKRSGITIAQLARNTFESLVGVLLGADVAKVLEVVDAETWETVKEVHAKLSAPSRKLTPEQQLEETQARIDEIYEAGRTDISVLQTTYAAELETLFVAQRRAKDKIAKAKEAKKDEKKAASAGGK